MAKIPTDLALGSRPTPRPTRQLPNIAGVGRGVARGTRAVAAGANRTGTGLLTLAKGLEETGQTIVRSEDRIRASLDKIGRTKAENTFNEVANAELNRLKLEADIGQPETMTRFSNFLDSNKTRLLDSHGGSFESRAALESRLEGLYGAYLRRAGTDSANARALTVASDFDEKVNSYYAHITENPGNLRGTLDALNREFQEVAPLLPQDVEIKALPTAQQTIIRGAVDSYVRAGNYEAARAIAADEAYFDILTPKDRKAIEASLDRGRRLDIAELKPLTKDHLASLTATGQGVAGVSERAKTLLEGDDLAEFIEAEQRAVTVYNSVEAMRFAPPDQIQATVQSLRPEPGSEDFDANNKVYENALNIARDILAQRARDPAGYAGRMPEVEAALSAAREGGNTEQALSLRIQVQRDMGIQIPKTLSNAEAEQVAADLSQSPGQDRAQQILDLQASYGRHFDQAFREISETKLIDERTKFLASVAGNPALSQAVSQVIDLGGKELREGLAQADVTAMKERVRDELAGFQGAVEARDFTGGSTTFVNGITSMVTDVALSLMRKGESPEAAAQKAAQQLINDRFVFISTDSIEAMMPLAVDGRALSENQVIALAGGAQTREAIEAFGPMPFQTLAEDVGDEILAERTIRTAVNSGFWVTNDTGDGLILMVPFQGGGALPLLNALGKPYEVKFSESFDVVPEITEGDIETTETGP